MSVIGPAFFVALIAVGYLLLSGVAFLSVYWWAGPRPEAVLCPLVAPLEIAARRFASFGRFYNAFHGWCYRVFVRSEEEA
jgi:hypothetical protein